MSTQNVIVRRDHNFDDFAHHALLPGQRQVCGRVVVILEVDRDVGRDVDVRLVLCRVGQELPEDFTDEITFLATSGGRDR